MIKCKIVFLCMLFLITAEAQHGFSLQAILDTIEKNNPLLLSYQDRISSSNEMVNTANAWIPPKAGLELDKNLYSFDNFYSGVVRTSLAQDFPNRKVIDAKTNYLKSLSLIDQNESMYVRNKLFSDAKSAFSGIYITQRKIKVLTDNIGTLRSMIEVAEKQLSTGSGELAQIFKLKAKLIESETMLVHEENMVKTYIATLNYLMNADVNRNLSIDTTSVIKDYRNLFMVYSKDSIECKRSDIMQMNSMIKALRLNKELVALRSKATFGLRVEHFWIPEKPDMFSLMGTLTIPFVPWVARGYKSEVKAIGFKVDAMEKEKQHMINMTSQMIKMLIIEMNSEYQEIDNYTKKVIPAYQRSFEANMLAYGQNTAGLFHVLLAFDDLQMAQMEYIEHLGVLLKVQVDYEKELQIR